MSLSESTVAAFASAGTPTIASQLLKRGFRDQYIHGIAAISEGSKIIGPAWTMRTIPAREDMEGLWPGSSPEPGLSLFAVVESVPQGNVLVIDSHEERRTATGGDILLHRLKAKGAAGIVTDGSLRDVDGIRSTGLPSFCAGATANVSRSHLRVVEQNIPIGCGGTAVYPGDIIVGDADGVLVVPEHCANDVARDSCEQELLEEYLAERIRNGESLEGIYPPSAQVRAEFAEQRGKK
ncbi:ribonuclease activity regulator RraA [Brevibacterium sp. CCUG 69071]|uniref:RraA family protein n=1 Tax=Brevibacterium sp. CCUG 69071 TaxID=2052937 RepID=UPI001E5D82D6|nr:ribonuclease activity regulator RraA [Brevibacterium sp. CCUG 69071]MCD1287647.1 ribonuclease activity regulator RraA [Brevibacterium sp. CCUG 69071]